MKNSYRQLNSFDSVYAVVFFFFFLFPGDGHVK